MRELRTKAGLAVEPEDADATAGTRRRAAREQRQVVPQSAVARNLANPFLAPDFSAALRPRGHGHGCSPTGS